MIDLLAAATAALSHAFVNAVVLFVKLVAVSTVIALAIATAIDYVGMPMEFPTADRGDFPTEFAQ